MSDVVAEYKQQEKIYPPMCEAIAFALQSC